MLNRYKISDSIRKEKQKDDFTINALTLSALVSMILSVISAINGTDVSAFWFGITGTLLKGIEYCVLVREISEILIC